MRYVNLGCGVRYHRDWINIDLVSTGPGVIAHDLSKGIPLEDGSCDAVYHAAVLEHIRRQEALPFLNECRRVLKPGGIIRVVVPDLERTCRLYLEKLDAADAGDPAAAQDYDWMMIELIDQTTREHGGGEMLEYFRQGTIPNGQFVAERIGDEARVLEQSFRPPPAAKIGAGPPRLTARRVVRALRKRALRRLLGRDDWRALQIGTFRVSGEVHQWMYDRFSLARLLRLAGFQDPVRRAPQASLIAGWETFHLDALPDGTVVKPDCFAMEAVNPERT